VASERAEAAREPERKLRRSIGIRKSPVLYCTVQQSGV
jgi:hypothetical protein